MPLVETYKQNKMEKIVKEFLDKRKIRIVTYNHDCEYKHIPMQKCKLFIGTLETADSTTLYIVTDNYDEACRPSIDTSVYANDLAAQEEFETFLDDIVYKGDHSLDTYIYAGDFEEWVSDRVLYLYIDAEYEDEAHANFYSNED